MRQPRVDLFWVSPHSSPAVFLFKNMARQQSFKVRDKRNKGWFWLDNAYLNGYAKIFGPVGTAIYVSLCRHADNETQKCFPSQKLIAEELNTSERTVRKYLKLFEKYNLISVERERDDKTQKWLTNVYILLDKSQWKKPEEIISYGQPAENNNTSQRKITTESQRKQFPHNNTHIYNNTHNNKTNILYATSDEVAGSVINELIDLFKGVNPTYQRLFNNKTEREALKRLIKQFGKEKIAKLIKALPEIITKPYAPRITTPYQLEKKLADLLAFIQQERSAKSKYQVGKV